jgi:hypothetical protein
MNAIPVALSTRAATMISPRLAIAEIPYARVFTLSNTFLTSFPQPKRKGGNGPESVAANPIR